MEASSDPSDDVSGDTVPEVLLDISGSAPETEKEADGESAEEKLLSDPFPETSW